MASHEYDIESSESQFAEEPSFSVVRRPSESKFAEPSFSTRQIGKERSFFNDGFSSESTRSRPGRLSEAKKGHDYAQALSSGFVQGANATAVPKSSSRGGLSQDLELVVDLPGRSPAWTHRNDRPNILRDRKDRNSCTGRLCESRRNVVLRLRAMCAWLSFLCALLSPWVLMAGAWWWWFDECSPLGPWTCVPYGAQSYFGELSLWYQLDVCLDSTPNDASGDALPGMRAFRLRSPTALAGEACPLAPSATAREAVPISLRPEDGFEQLSSEQYLAVLYLPTAVYAVMDLSIEDSTGRRVLGLSSMVVGPDERWPWADGAGSEVGGEDEPSSAPGGRRLLKGGTSRFR